MRTVETQRRFTLLERQKCVEHAPFPIPDSWELWVTTRPLYGTVSEEHGRAATWTGNWCWGILWAAIDPTDPDADQWRKENCSLDGKLLTLVTVEQAVRAYRGQAYGLAPEAKAKMVERVERVLANAGAEMLDEIAHTVIQNANEGMSKGGNRWSRALLAALAEDEEERQAIEQEWQQVGL